MTIPSAASSHLPPARLVEALAAAPKLVVLTGAGMSAESGIPTFRDAQTGLWARFDPMQLATQEGYQSDPALVWGWYEARRRQALLAQPNAGHRALRALQLRRPRGVTIVTQNVDDLHERAGSTDVIHLHGSLFAPRCFDCGRPFDRLPDARPHKPSSPDDTPARLAPPACTHCSGPARPGVVWFGEALPSDAWSRSLAAVQAADMVLVVGTSGRVYPAASLPEAAEERGTPVWVIDPDPAAARNVACSWATSAAVGLPALADHKNA